MEIEFSEKELAALKKEYASAATDAQFTLWIETCKRRGLVPVEDVVLQLRSAQEYDEVAKAKVYVKKVVFITTLRALLKLAERTGRYRGFVPAQYIYLDDHNLPTVVSEFPLPDPRSPDKPLVPWAAKVGVKRAGFDEPQFEIARFWAYAQTYKDDGKAKLNSTWTTRGPEQLVKCCKAAAIRGAFPEELGGLFLEEELQNEELGGKVVETKPEPEKKSLAPATTPAAPSVNHTPAEGAATPRPGEKAEKVDASGPVSTAVDSTVQTVPASGSTPTTDKTKPPRTKQRASKKTDAPATPPSPATEAPPQTASDQAAPPVETADHVPTTEEFQGILSRLVKFRDRLGGAGSADSKKLKQFVLTQASATDTKLVTSQQWEQILKTLDSAVDDDDLKSIISR